MLTSISWCRRHSPEQTGKCQRKVRPKCPGRAKSPALSWQPLLEPCSWEPRVLQGPEAQGSSRAAPRPGEPAQDQLVAVHRAGAEPQPGTTAELLSIFIAFYSLSSPFLNTSKQSSTSDGISLEMETFVLLIAPSLHTQPCPPHCLSSPVCNCKRVRNKWT